MPPETPTLGTVRTVSWVDVVVVVVIAAAAVHGLRVGALVQVLTLAGFALGVTVGALLTGVAAPLVHDPALRVVVALGLVIGLGALGSILGHLVGSVGNLAARRHRLGPLDSAAGVGVAVVAGLFAVWLVANELAQTQYTWLSAAIQRSGIVRAVDQAMPPLPNVFSRVQAFLGSTGLPPVFTELEPAPVHVPTPSAAWAARVARTAAGSTVKVLGNACGYLQEGSAFVVAPGMVATNAHVVAGEQSTTVVVKGAQYPAVTVSFDPTFDLAILRTSAPLGPPLPIDGSSVPSGTWGAVIGYPEDGPLSIRPAAVATELSAEGRNIYNEGTVVRSVYQIDATIQPGNSGGPLLDGHGEVIGVVFSRSTVYQGVGYALASPGVLRRVDDARGRTRAVSTGACTSR